MKKKLKIWWDYYVNRTICGAGMIVVLILTYRLIGTQPTPPPETWGWSDIAWFWFTAFCWIVIAYNAGKEKGLHSFIKFKRLSDRLTGAKISTVNEDGTAAEEQDLILAVRHDGLAVILQDAKPEDRDRFLLANGKELLKYNLNTNFKPEDAK